jgi:hypothetical protein
VYQGKEVIHFPSKQRAYADGFCISFLLFSTQVTTGLIVFFHPVLEQYSQMAG